MNNFSVPQLPIKLNHIRHWWVFALAKRWPCVLDIISYDIILSNTQHYIIILNYGFFFYCSLGVGYLFIFSVSRALLYMYSLSLCTVVIKHYCCRPRGPRLSNCYHKQDYYVCAGVRSGEHSCRGPWSTSINNNCNIVYYTYMIL